MEADEARDLIEEAIERSEAGEREERAAERRFRDRVSVLVGVFALSLALIHMAAASAQRESLLKSIEASDTYAYMQAKIVRETVLATAATSAGLDPAARAADLAEAHRLRAPDKAGHGIDQLQEKGTELREESEAAASASEGFDTGETAMQLAIVLLSIALIAQSWPIVAGASLLAVIGIGFSVVTFLAQTFPR